MRTNRCSITPSCLRYRGYGQPGGFVPPGRPMRTGGQSAARAHHSARGERLPVAGDGFTLDDTVLADAGLAAIGDHVAVALHAFARSLPAARGALALVVRGGGA